MKALVHVTLKPDVLDPQGIAEERIEIGKGVHEALAKLKADHQDGVPELHTAVVAAEHAVVAICDYAREHDIDLIVMGATGRGGVSRLLVGSTAERVARHAPCAVLLAR